MDATVSLKKMYFDLERYTLLPSIMWQQCEHRICLLTTSVSFLSNGATEPHAGYSQCQTYLLLYFQMS